MRAVFEGAFAAVRAAARTAELVWLTVEAAALEDSSSPVCAAHPSASGARIASVETEK